MAELESDCQSAGRATKSEARAAAGEARAGSLSWRRDASVEGRDGGVGDSREDSGGGA